jgi:serine/threonine protein kinase
VDSNVRDAEAPSEAEITREIPGFGRGTDGPRPKSTFVQNPLAADEPEFRLPEAGQSFLGFLLDRELGRGAVGRVFLARQPDMADRPVVLKVTKGRAAEAQALARLRHTNIVPIYSAHEGPGFFALCMPYDGGVTFAAVLEKLRSLAEIPTSGHFFADLCQADAPGAAVAAATFDRLSFSDAVLMLGGRLAKGLAHAHDRGLIHCDRSPPTSC